MVCLFDSRGVALSLVYLVMQRISTYSSNALWITLFGKKEWAGEEKR